MTSRDDDLPIPRLESSRDVWRDYALSLQRQLATMYAYNQHASRMYSEEMRKRFIAEEKLADRKPKGRPALPPETVSAIAGATGSTRKIAARFGVSAMTVSRIKKAALDAKANPAP